MHAKPILLSLILLVNCLAVFGQNTLSGVVIDPVDNKPIPYVSIGITSKPDGTVSNALGEFKLDLVDGINDNDTLKFSSIGYHSAVFLVRALKQKAKEGALNIILNKAVVELKPVVIASRPTTAKILGYETTSKLLGYGFGTNSIGSQGGIRLSIKHPNTNLESMSFFVIQNSFQSLTFRVNVYEMKNGRPGDNILTDNVIFKIGDKQTGKISVDLSHYNIYVNNDVLITLEWISANPSTGGMLDIAAVVFGSTFYRKASEYYWIKRGTGLGLSVKANY